MLHHIKTIISMMALCVLVASCGRQNDTAKAINKLEEQRKEILEAYRQLLDLDADQVSRELEIKEIDWKMPEYTSKYKLAHIFAHLIDMIHELKEEIANFGSTFSFRPVRRSNFSSSFNSVMELCLSYNKAKFKLGKELEGLKKELEYFELLKERYKLAIA